MPPIQINIIIDHQAMEFVEGNRVLEHILMRNKVLDGDNYVLHVQVRAPACGGRQGGDHRRWGWGCLFISSTERLTC